jgi:hypothetical protein
MKDEILPSIINGSEDIINGLIKLVEVPRELLPPKEKIENVLLQLPVLLSNIREDLRDERLAKMCIAIGVGLFDSAVNYVWNQTIIEIRKRIITFGLDVVKQLKSKEYTDEDIDNMQDSHLLDIAHELNLIDNEGYYFLNQCRDIRNNFSAAHPSIGEIDNYELVSYINRCIKYSLGRNIVTIGVDIKSLLSTMDTTEYDEDQIKFWHGKISTTHQAQKDVILTMLFGIYCDPSKKTITRSNALTLSIFCKKEITNKTLGDIINQYEEYLGKGDENRRKAAEYYVIHMGLMDSLRENTRHSIIFKLCKQMMAVHSNLNNFYNEPPFAEYLLVVSSQSEIPDTVKYEFVTTVMSCAVGNEYGVSNGATGYYNQIIKNFSPKEVEIMLKIPDEETYLAYKVTKYPKCIYQYKQKILLLNQQVIVPSLMPLYQKRII